jgi:carbon-monoxide dehydrogenase small subunit
MTARYRVKLEVNGAVVEIEVEARETLLDALRHRLGLTGTHAGCEEGSCGACTVLIDGDVVRSCLVLAVQLEGRSVTTIEALGQPNDLHPVQEALRRHHGLQCGFCTPGVVLTAVDLLAHNPSPTEPEIRQALAGNLCRCTGYAGIVAAVLELAQRSEEEP